MRVPEWDWWRWRARRVQARVGVPLLLAAVLTAAAVALLAVSAGLRGETQRLRQLDRVQSALPLPPPTGAGDNDRRLAGFFAVLPERSQMPDTLKALFALGAKHGVALQQGDYRLEREDSGIIRCHIRFPVMGETGKLEGFIWEALRAFPALALEGVMLQRESALQSAGNVEIRFILFMKADTPDQLVADLPAI